MWNKQSDPAPASSSQQPAWDLSQPASAASTGMRSGASLSRTISRLGAGIEIMGKISGEEDLQIDGKVEGSVMLNGQ